MSLLQKLKKIKGPNQTLTSYKRTQKAEIVYSGKSSIKSIERWSHHAYDVVDLLDEFDDKKIAMKNLVQTRYKS